MELEPRGNGGVLMDQCSRHDTPPAFSVYLTNWLGHDLAIELKAQTQQVLTSQQLGGKPASFDAGFPDPLDLV
jgi:hypothetical protein